MALSPIFWLFQTIPEALALTTLALVLSNAKIDLKNVVFIALPYAVAVYLIRLLPIVFGVHFIVLIIFLAVLLNLRLKMRFSRCLLNALLVCLFLAVAETLLMYLLSVFTGITFEQATESLKLFIIFAWPQIIFLFLLALLIYKWRASRRAGSKGEHV